jgi:predicted CoA-binding protein
MQILESARTVAVVGLSSSPGRASYRVAAYLNHAGYHVIPVNHLSNDILGEKSYPDPESIPAPVDVVEIFRPSEKMTPFVEQAIRIRAKVVWMQSGIVNEAAAGVARASGLKVVVDRCMKIEHRRLVAELFH